MIVHSDKNLEQLENRSLKSSDLCSHVVTQCNKLWSIPINKLSVENLRLLIGQNLGLYYLVPIALGILEQDPLADGNLYKGDLLASIASIDDKFWSNNRQLNNRLVNIRNELILINETISEDLLPKLERYEFT